MKKGTLHIFAFMILFANLIYSQNTYSSHMLKYDGPKNKQELSKLLFNSNELDKLNLNIDYKIMLYEVIIFHNGRITRMDSESSNPNIAKFYSDPKLVESVFTAIFKAPVKVVTADTRPIVTRVNMAELNQLIHDNGNTFASTIVFCSNCAGLDGGSGRPGQWCCQVGGNGCYDYVIPFNNQLYALD